LEPRYSRRRPFVKGFAGPARGAILAADGQRGSSVLPHDATALIGLDWGTTRLRAYRVAADGTVLERRSRDAGILKVEGGDFAGTLTATAGDWLAAHPTSPVLASGMIGSRQGWREVPYVPCPTGLHELVSGLGTVAVQDGRTVRLVPGLSSKGADGGFPDVMRGEETQVIGLLASVAGTSTRCCVLPGTHSKWVWTEAGRIVAFATWMTGELYELVTRHGILGRLMTAATIDEAAFDRGLARSRASAGSAPGRLLHDLFSARTLPLLGELQGEGVAGYLSGLLVGAEVVAALAEHPSQAVTILGGSDLAALYARALTAAGVAVEVGDADAAARGLHALARAAGLIEERAHA
jgi:2-dehydro-3-deoxygalactonokinase